MRGISPRLSRAGAIAIAGPAVAMRIDTRAPNGLIIPGFGADLPDAMFVRAGLARAVSKA
jgi:hypothetical protein